MLIVEICIIHLELVGALSLARLDRRLELQRQLGLIRSRLEIMVQTYTGFGHRVC